MTPMSNIAAMLNINWLIDGRRDDTPPGGALVFELWQRPGGSVYEVRTYYTSQTLEQMRNVTPLTLDKPPARADVFLPGCSTGAANYPCNWKAFRETLTTAIDPAFVK
jgi:4-phytase/acid phosphatase